jgi:hypothetical protein
MRLGLPPAAMLARLLDPAAGPALYEQFRRAVRAPVFSEFCLHSLFRRMLC